MVLDKYATDTPCRCTEQVLLALRQSGRDISTVDLGTTCQHYAGRQMQSLKLWTTGGEKFGRAMNNENYLKVVDNLRHSWLIEPDVGDVVHVRELDRQAREMRDQELTDEVGLGSDMKGSQAMQIFRRIWPSKQNSRDWRDDWSSLPLQV